MYALIVTCLLDVPCSSCANDYIPPPPPTSVDVDGDGTKTGLRPGPKRRPAVSAPLVRLEVEAGEENIDVQLAGRTVSPSRPSGPDTGRAPTVRAESGWLQPARAAPATRRYGVRTVCPLGVTFHLLSLVI